MSLKSSKKIDTNRYQLEVSIDAETFKAAVNTAYRKNVGKINVPGFRKGKAPRGIIEKMYGKDVFYDDALEALYPGAIDEAADAAGVVIVDFKDVKFDLKSMDENGVEFSVEVTVSPEVTLGEYKGLKATRKAAEATDEDINDEIERMRERSSRMVTVEDRAAAKDDIVVFDFEGFVDGVAFEGGKAESYSLKLGSNQFIPGFEDQIIGHNTGDEFDVNVKFPEDYQAEELKGKDATFKCKLHEIKVRELPDVDDDFVKDISTFDTLEEYKKDVAEKIVKRKTEDSEKDVDTQLIEALIADMKVEIPQAMIDTKIDENIRDFEYTLQMQGLNLKQYLQYTGATVDVLKDQYKEQSEKQVKMRLALEKVAELEKIKPTDKEIEAQYQEYADAYQMDIAKVKSYIPVKEITADLKVKKASDFIKDNAEIKDEKAKKPAAKKTASTAKKADTDEKPAAKKTTSTAKKTTSTAKKTTTTAAKKPAAKKPAAKKAEDAAE